MANLEISKAPRLDQHVLGMIPQLSRSFVARLISEGKVTVNQQVVLKPGYKIRQEDQVAVDYDMSQDQNPPSIMLPIVYEDDDCVVIDKPVGVLTHSKGVHNPEATVASWLRDLILSQGNSKAIDTTNQRAGIVHRLDRATSGVMICAKNQEALSWLQKQFSQRKVKKTYLALIEGAPKHPKAVIDMPIERNPKAPATFRVGPNGKSAVTHYEVIAQSDKFTLLKLSPVTGRTHQLRVHLKHIGHPIIGDMMYGGKAAERLCLHAESLEITIPQGHQRKVFLSAAPALFGNYFGKS